MPTELGALSPIARRIGEYLRMEDGQRAFVSRPSSAADICVDGTVLRVRTDLPDLLHALASGYLLSEPVGAATAELCVFRHKSPVSDLAIVAGERLVLVHSEHGAKMFLGAKDLVSGEVIAGSWTERVESIDRGHSSESGPLVLRLVDLEISRLLVAARPDLLLLHAASLVRHGRALLLLGASGAGKSTLSFALAARGWAMSSDDVSAVAPASSTVRALPRTSHLRAEGAQLLRAWEVAAGTAGAPGSCLSPARFTESSRIRTFVFLDGFADRASVRDISVGEALDRLSGQFVVRPLAGPGALFLQMSELLCGVELRALRPKKDDLGATLEALIANLDGDGRQQE